MAASSSRKETLLHCTIQPFTRQFWMQFFSVKMLSANDWHVISVENFHEVLQLICRLLRIQTSIN
jgi:hypothetical protein